MRYVILSQKKINVFIEKPLSITKYEVYSLLETAKKINVYFM